MSNDINRPTLHRDGSVTFWSVYRQVWERTSLFPGDRELAAMGESNRRRIALHLASHGDEAAQEYLDEQQEVRDFAIAILMDEAASAGDHERVRLCETALGVHMTDGSYPTEQERREARERCAGLSQRDPRRSAGALGEG